MDWKTGKTMYDVLVEDAQALGASNLSTHEIDSTFFRGCPDPKGNVFYQKSDGTPFVASFIAEIGSEGRGLGWPRIRRSLLPPINLQPMNDGNSKSYRMVLALRCPTGAPPELHAMFINGLATCDRIRGDDKQHEVDNNQRFDVTEWIISGENDPDEDIVLLARLHPTYEVPHNSSTKDSSSRTPRKRISKVDSTAKSDQLSDGMPDADADSVGPQTTDINTKSAINILLASYYTDRDRKLIAPEELYATLTEGTLVHVMVSLATYVITDQKTEKGTLIPDKKIYHVLVDRLKVLDRGDAEPWNPPVPVIPEPRFYLPTTSPQRRGRDDAADTASNTFGSKSSPSPTKRARHNVGST
ncbi:hypothetical protein DFH07DRAFT_951830 [Mycena maculata]|uniref:Uncharacterized protein n=1 Tax=Mycena maculata TaxID=230809 RepID=A0AAD7K527_9AGAR|nr:hypothetical protein DFH07DRAFT_951830 [Mycena maculata]